MNEITIQVKKLSQQYAVGRAKIRHDILPDEVAFAESAKVLTVSW